MRSLVHRTAVIAAIGLACAATAAAQFDDPDGFASQRTLRCTPPAEVRDELLQWLASQQADEQSLARAGDVWADAEDATGPDVLTRLARTVALVDARAEELLAQCAYPRHHVVVPAHNWLAEEELPPLIRDNLRLFYGRWLVQEKMYDEAIAQLESLQPADVVDPASLLFYQSVVHHRLLRREEGLKSIRTLQEDVDGSPRRYTALVTLMEDDLRALEDDSLDHISRRMEDIGRRLEFGRAGERVVRIENGVIDSLDKLIEEMEQQQQQQQQQQAAASGNRIQSTQPAPDSAPIGGLGPGDVDNRDIGSDDGWGKLPPKERQKAMQQIGQEFPSHYGDAIQQYFRRLAGDRRPN